MSFPFPTDVQTRPRFEGFVRAPVGDVALYRLGGNCSMNAASQLLQAVEGRSSYVILNPVIHIDDQLNPIGIYY